MKNILKLLFLAITLLIFSGCDNKSPDNDLKKMNLNGDVILIKDGGKYIFFDDKGNITRDYNDYNPKSISISNYYYIDKKLIKKINLRKSIIGNEVYIDENQIDYNYGIDGNLTKIDLKTPETSNTTYYFYKNGKLIRDSLIQTSSAYIKSSIESFFYNDDVLIKSENIGNFFNSLTELESGKSFDSYKYVYFYENGIIKKEIDAEGKTLLYEYENDLKGNFIKQKKSNGDVWKREIFYKGDDISLYENKFEEIKKEISTSSSEKNKIKSNSNSQLNQKQNCNECQGTGSVSCNDCAGSGQHRCDFCKGSKIYHDDICIECRGSGMETCRTCFGKGKTKCYKCDGTGQL